MRDVVSDFVGRGASAVRATSYPADRRGPLCCGQYRTATFVFELIDDRLDCTKTRCTNRLGFDIDERKATPIYAGARFGWV